LDANRRMLSLSDIEKVFEWVNKVKKFFEPFKPEFRDMRINYRTQQSEMSLALNIPNSIRRSMNKIEIPAYQNFQVSEMIDESFSKVQLVWHFDNGKWIMNPLNLPASERYLLKLRGEVPKEIVSDIVRIQPAQNRDQTSEMDKYWLNCVITNVDYFEKIYRQLEVSDVDITVRVGIERCFSTTFSEEFKRVLEASQRWIHAGHGHDRNEIQRAWGNLRRVAGSSQIKVGEITRAIYELTVGKLFVDYLSVDVPYSLGEIRREERFMGLFPEKMSVEATTDLSLKRPIATGYLTFKKKEYTKRIEEFLSKLKE